MWKKGRTMWKRVSCVRPGEGAGAGTEGRGQGDRGKGHAGTLRAGVRGRIAPALAIAGAFAGAAPGGVAAQDQLPEGQPGPWQAACGEAGAAPSARPSAGAGGAARRLSMLDGDGDGRISIDEMVRAEACLAAGRARAGYRRLLRRHDADGDGMLSREELARAVAAGRRADSLFARIDSDGNGSLSREEFRRAWRARSAFDGGGGAVRRSRRPGADAPRVKPEGGEG